MDNFQIVYLTAVSDFETAIALISGYPEINDNKEVISIHARNFGLPVTNTLLELEQSLIDNLFKCNTTSELRLKYWTRKYSFFDAIRMAVMTDDEVFLKEYEKYWSRLYDLCEEFQMISFMLGFNSTYIRNRHPVYLYSDGLYQIAKFGFLDRVPYMKLLHDEKFIRHFIGEIVRTQNWKLLEEFLASDHKISNERIVKCIAANIVSAGSVDLFKNPPEIITRISGWETNKHFYIEYSIQPPFPFILRTKEQVEYYKEEILTLYACDINDMLKSGNMIHAYESIAAIVELYPKGSVKPSYWCISNRVSAEEETKICLLFEEDPIKRYMDTVLNYWGESSSDDLHCILMELVKLKAPGLEKYLKKYLEEFPDPLIKKALEELERSN